MNPNNVIVIGAGAAGLMAAYELSSNGIPTTILEARGRIGGRIYTHHDSRLGVPIEYGAEFIHGHPPQILELANRFHLPIRETSGRHRRIETNPGHSVIRSDEFWARLEKIFIGMKRRKGADISFADFLERSSADLETKQTAMSFIQGFHAADPNLIGIRGLNLVNKAAQDIDSDTNFRILTGYDSLMQALCDSAVAAGAQLHLNSIVREIQWKPGQVRVHCDDGLFESSFVLVTLPLGVLKVGAVKFDPEIDRWKKALRVVHTGHAVHVALQFREAFWESDMGFIHASNCPLPTWWSQSPIRVPYLVGWAGGPAAENFRSNDQIHNAAMKSLNSIFGLPVGELDSLLSATYFHNWTTDPFARGAYSYVGVDGLSAQKTLAKSVNDTIFFAGEATETKGFSGTVHGAVMTGKRAAAEILKCV